MSAVSCALRFKSRNSQKKMANGMRCHSTVRRTIFMCDEMNVWDANLRNFHGRAVGVQRLLPFFLGKYMPFCR